MRYQQPSMEGTMFAMRDQEGGRGMVRNILIGQAANSVGNMLLDAFEPEKRKTEEEKDLGDRFRDFTRTALNLGTSANYALQMARGYGLLDNEPKGAVQGEAQNFNERTPASPPPRPGAAETAPSQTEGYAPYGLLKGDEPTMTERTRQGEALVKAARAERMPGLVVTDLSAMVDQEQMNRLRGLEKEAAAYPKKKEEPSDYEKGVAAGMEAMTMRQLQSQAPSQTIDVTFTDEERRSTPYTAAAPSSNPLLSREPMGFNETFGVKGGVPMARAARKEEDEESLANFYANLPADPSTGERQLNFATKYLAGKGSIDPETVMVVDPEVDTPRNSGGLLQGQLRGETLYNQQENREPFVQDQQMDAINSVDEQGPGFKSNRTAAEVLQNTLSKTMEQLSQKETPAFAPTPEMVGNYVKPEFRAETSTGSKESSALVAPSMTLSAEPTVKKTTIIEETVPAAQTRMSPFEASEKLRRIQTSGRPTARQEAQDFLQSIKGQMIDG